jgi:hypothetical protein
MEDEGVTRVESRPLSAEEERRLLEEASAGPSRFEAGCMAFFAFGAIPALGWLVADNLVAWLGSGNRWWGLGIGLLAGIVWGASPLVLVRRATRDRLRESRRLQLAAAPVERWTIEASRAWEVECSQTRALLFELPDGRLVLVASHLLEPLPPGAYPQLIELETLPQLDRVLGLATAGPLRPTEAPRLTLEELGNDYPLKKRRFVELAPEGLEPATRERLGLPPAPRAPEPAPEASGLVLDAVTERTDETVRLRRLATPVARRLALLLTWVVPATALLALASGRARGARGPAGGATASLLLVFIVLWLLAVVAAELLRWRSALRVLAAGHGPLVHVHGRVRAERTFPAPLTGRAAAVARADLLLGPHTLMQAVDFAVEADDGSRTEVDARHAWLLEEGGGGRVVRIETATAERLARGADGLAAWYRKRRWQYPLELLVQDGDVVHLLGRRDTAGRIHGTADSPLLLWSGSAMLRRPFS